MAERILDVLIRNATLVDGSGAAPASRSVGVAEGKIVLEGLGNAKAASTLDAAGLVLAPGFIDAHGHTDLMVNMDPLAAAKLCQGITTEIAGQCGLSLAPVSAEFFPLFKLYFEGWGARLYPNHAELRSVGAFMETMESMKPGINLALFAAHGTLRLAAMGMDPGRPDARQMALMEALAKEAMEAGALGLSSGLMYSPGSFAETEELVALCAAMAPYGAIYTSHIRNQGNELLDSVRETLDVARRAGATANISHHKAVGKSNWGKVSDSIRMIHEEGNATHDVYPYAASSTNLLATLPPSCMKEGLDVLMGQLSDRAYLEELERRIFEPVEKWDNDLLECGLRRNPRHERGGHRGRSRAHYRPVRSQEGSRALRGLRPPPARKLARGGRRLLLHVPRRRGYPDRGSPVHVLYRLPVRVGHEDDSPPLDRVLPAHTRALRAREAASDPRRSHTEDDQPPRFEVRP